MRFGSWIIEATDTHSEYVTLIETDNEVVARELQNEDLKNDISSPDVCETVRRPVPYM